MAYGITRCLSRVALLIIIGILILFALGLTTDEPPASVEGELAAVSDPSCSDSVAKGFILSEIPVRSVDAIGGKEFAKMTKGWSGRNRQKAALQEIRQGNIPDFLRHLKPVYLEDCTSDGRNVHAVVWVTPDYLSIGSDEDFLRIPLTRPSAVTITQAFGCVLPTRKIVDAIADSSAQTSPN